MVRANGALALDAAHILTVQGGKAVRLVGYQSGRKSQRTPGSPSLDEQVSIDLTKAYASDEVHACGRPLGSRVLRPAKRERDIGSASAGRGPAHARAGAGDDNGSHAARLPVRGSSGTTDPAARAGRCYAAGLRMKTRVAVSCSNSMWLGVAMTLRPVACSTVGRVASATWSWTWCRIWAMRS